MVKKFQNTSLKNFPAVFDLNTLNGKNGFVIPGLTAGDGLGHAVDFGGDINGDGLADFVFDAVGKYDQAGEIYVIFGNKSGFGPSFNLSTLNGANGFRISGLENKDALDSLDIKGDINGDGLADFAFGALSASPNGKQSAGEIYVIFGNRLPFPSSFNIDALDGKNGFKIPGLRAGDNLGMISRDNGDINGDGINDLVFGAYLASPNSVYSETGEAYVIFGNQSPFSPIFDLNTLNGVNGFRISGLKVVDLLGSASAIGGDINGDGIEDFALAAWNANAGAGEVYAIFGSQLPFSPTFNLTTLNGNNGFKISGVMAGDNLGTWGLRMKGDINRDHKDDLIVGARYASPNGKSKAGEVYVIYGSEAKFSSPFNLTTLDGRNGFRIPGLVAGGNLGEFIAFGGDMNGDGGTDIALVEASDPNENPSIGEAYIIFGNQVDFPSPFNLSTLDGTNGFRIPGLAEDYFSWSLAMNGDINGDSKSDLVIGIQNAGIFNKTNAGGKVYVIFSNPNVENYGMLSVTDHFKPMNGSSDIGMVNIGSTDQWCNAKLLHIGDFNGDTMSDLICNMDAQNSIMLATRAGYDVTFVPIDGDPNGKTKIGVNDKWCDNSFQELLAGDFNADNKTDLLCRSVQGQDSGQNYVMLSNGTGFNPMASSSDGKVKVGELGKFCANSSRLITGDFNGNGADNLLCNTYDPRAGSMIMIPNGTSFTPINNDILGRVTMGDHTGCFINWCQEAGSVLRSGDFNKDGKDDLLCNFQGKNMIMLSSIGASWPCDFKPITSNGKTSSDGYISIGKNQQWCDTSKFKLLVEDVNGDQMVDLVCNERGLNKIMLCESDGADGYQFKSINATNTEGQVYMGDHSKWCLSQNLLGGDYNGDTLGDLLCNQGGQVADPFLIGKDAVYGD